MYFPLRCAALGAALLFAVPAWAVIGNPKSTGVTKGKVSLQYKGSRAGDGHASENNDQKHEFEAYYGLTDRLKLGAEHILRNAPQEGRKTESNIVNATYNTTRQHEGWWLSSAVFAGYGLTYGAPDTLGLVLVGERAQGPFNVTLNFGFTREIGDHSGSGVAYDTALQVKYLWLKQFNPAFEWHAEYGKLHDPSPLEQQGHYVGPYFSGQLYDTGAGAIKWGAGYFWGLTDASADNAQRVLLEYEFLF